MDFIPFPDADSIEIEVVTNKNMEISVVVQPPTMLQIAAAIEAQVELDPGEYIIDIRFLHSQRDVDGPPDDEQGEDDEDDGEYDD